MHPCKVYLLEKHLEDQLDRINCTEQEPDFVNSILYLDEVTFCLNGFINRHNWRSFSYENAQWIGE